MKIQESGENYLETILILQNKNGYVRSVDVASELGYSKPSVSRAMSILRTSGYITMDDKNSQITLTAAGKQRAEDIYERHCLITKYLVDVLGVTAATASEDACRIEHIISDESFNKMKEQVVRLK